MRVHHPLLEVAVLALAAVWMCLSKPTLDRGHLLLPPSLQPEHYDISLSPSLQTGVFHGVVVISGIATTDTDHIVLHCKRLVFNSTMLQDMTENEYVEVMDIDEDELLQQCHLYLNSSLQVDHEYQLTMEFMGVIGKEGVGLYKESYSERGVKHEMLMTQFQPNYARAMFPCWDEPHYKAHFQLRVLTPDHFPTVLSNMPISTVLITDSEEENRTWVEFEETPPMSPYLLVLVMCDYLALSDSVSNTSVWAPRSRLHEAQLALNVSVEVLDMCEEYFGIEFALPKLDHILASGLNTGAMENWGAIVYKTECLLWEEGVSTLAQKEIISAVICHEVVHQWLGNLVTTGWWNTSWLNEGVTTFYHYYFLDKLEPSWNVMETMFIAQTQMVFSEEATKFVKPLTNNEPMPLDSISTLAFSASTYLKGAAIVRMVYNLMAPDDFREAIVQYIQDNEYGSVDEEDLWQSLAAVADLPIDLESVMYSWTHQTGFPLVTVLRSQDGCISVRQEKYLGKDESDIRWTIPLTYTTSLELNFNITNNSDIVWFSEEQEVMDLEECLEPNDWIIVNIQQSGFFRVNYDPLTWQALIHDLNNCDLDDIHPVNRAQLLNDGFDLARHGLLEYPVVLNLTRYLSRETDFLPWSVAIQWLNTLRDQLSLTETLPLFQKYALSLVEGVFSLMALTGETGGLLEENHRRQITEFACGLGHPRCIKEATDTVYLLMSGVDVDIPLDLEPVVLCNAVRHGQEEVWHFMLKQYREASENKRIKYLMALACSTNKEKLDGLVNDIGNPETSFVKSPEEVTNLVLELAKQQNSLDVFLDMALNMGWMKGQKLFDFQFVLNVFKSLVTHQQKNLTHQQRKKMIELSIIVHKTQSTKEIELMENIIAELDRDDFKTLHDDSVTEWFIQEVGEDDDEETTTEEPSTSLDQLMEPTIQNENDIEEDKDEGDDSEGEGEEGEEREEKGEGQDPGSNENDNAESINSNHGTNKDFSSINKSNGPVMIMVVIMMVWSVR